MLFLTLVRLPKASGIKGIIEETGKVINPSRLLTPFLQQTYDSGCKLLWHRANKEGGFVLYESKYIITDDLYVHPLFTVSLMKNIAPGCNSPNAEEITVDVSHKKLVGGDMGLSTTEQRAASSEQSDGTGHRKLDYTR